MMVMVLILFVGALCMAIAIGHEADKADILNRERKNVAAKKLSDEQKELLAEMDQDPEWSDSRGRAGESWHV